MRSKSEDDAFDEILAAADEIDRRPPVSIDRLRTEISRSNPMRWVSLQADLRWLKREMKKRKMNPEDARWLL